MTEDWRKDYAVEGNPFDFGQWWADRWKRTVETEFTTWAATCEDLRMIVDIETAPFPDPPMIICRMGPANTPETEYERARRESGVTVSFVYCGVDLAKTDETRVRFSAWDAVDGSPNPYPVDEVVIVGPPSGGKTHMPIIQMRDSGEITLDGDMLGLQRFLLDEPVELAIKPAYRVPNTPTETRREERARWRRDMKRGRK